MSACPKQAFAIAAMSLASALAVGASAAPRDAAASASYPNNEIYSVAVDGTAKRNLTRSRASDASPAPSPDGRKIAFLRGGELWIMNADGSRQRKLAGSGSISRPRWSPDGTRIAFATGRSGSESAVAVVRVDGSGLLRIENGWHPTWSPDGRRLAFLSDDSPQWRVGARTISVANADGTARRALYRLGEREYKPYAPVWAPKGTRIAVSFWSRDDSDLGLYIADAESGISRRLVSRGYGPSWSPDGRRLAFHGEDGVWITGTAQPNPRRLVGSAGFGVPRRPSWSPDGRWIACVTNHLLLVVNVRSGRTRVVARNARGAGPPAWSRNGRRIIFEGTA